jgi:endonuclease IV
MTFRTNEMSLINSIYIKIMLRYGPEVVRHGPEVPIPIRTIDIDGTLTELRLHTCQFYAAGSTDLNWIPFSNIQVFPPNFSFYVHSSHKMNWAGLKAYPAGITAKLLDQLANKPGAVVVHCGNAKDNTREGAIQLASKRVNIVQPHMKSTLASSLLLENASGKGNDIGKTLDELRLIFEGIDNTSRVGICLDTQHSFAAGLCKFDNEDNILNFLNDVDQIGPLRMVHLNDSRAEFNSGKDEHEQLAKGKIWAKSTSTLAFLVDTLINAQVDMICETGGYDHDVKVILNALTKYQIN